MNNTLDLLQRLGEAWGITLTCLNGEGRWQIRIQSHPSPRWSENFSYTYRGSLANVVARAYAGAPDDGAAEVAA